MLTVSYSHSQEHNEENKGYLRNEFRKQSFSRSFNLDDSIDCNGISAKYEAGVLILTLPKKENAQKVRRSIDVQ